MELKYKKRDDASARLGEKMLQVRNGNWTIRSAKYIWLCAHTLGCLCGCMHMQGWTLLGLTCPNNGCFTPFVRNKQGKMYCVNCDQYAVTEEEAKKERELQEQQQQQRDDELAAKQAQEEQVREQRIAQRFREAEQHKIVEQQQFERARAASQASTQVNGAGMCSRNDH